MSTPDGSSAGPRVVLVTGASRFLGGYLTARLAQNHRVERIIAVDTVAPSKDMLRRMGRAEFVRADIRNPLIGKVIRNASVDTVVHASLMSSPPGNGGRSVMKDFNVIGAMQLFAVCQKSPSVRNLVLRSSSAVYGSGPRDPVMFTEDMSARTRPRGAFARDALDVEGYARGLGRRRPDIAVAILRNAPMVGPRVNGTVSRYLASPVVPTIFGRDARMQLLHEEDALSALERATLIGRPGTYNIAAEGTVMLSQAIRRAGRIQVPVPAGIATGIGRLLSPSIAKGLTAEQIDYFRYGCGLDTTRMVKDLGFTPRWSTLQAVDDFVRGVGLGRVVKKEWVDAIEEPLLSALGESRPRRPVLVGVPTVRTEG